MVTDEIHAFSDQFNPDMVSARHQIHMCPELAYEEFQTAELITKVLQGLEIETRTQVAGTGVIGLIRGRGPGKTVLLRADMDALPIQEEANVPYRSRIPDRMHACGHDGHIAGLLGAAMILSAMRGTFDGNVKLVFQPAEEAGGGASRMIQEGVLDGPSVDAAFGCHLWGSLKEGTMHICPGPMMAAVDSFRFLIHGRGGHGALPHLSVDPITLAAQAINSMQTIVSRRVNPLDPVVLTIASIHSGSANNVIPESLEATGTFRTFNEELRRVIPAEMENILRGVTEANGASHSFELTSSSYPPVINHAGMTQIISDAFGKTLGTDHVHAHMTPIMCSEDFSFFSKSVPSAFAFVGIAKDEAHPVLHHHPQFQWDDRSIAILAEGFTQTALDFLRSS